MIEQELEEKVLDMVRASDCGFQIYGLWEVCRTGPKIDNADTAVVVVKVPPKRFETFGISEVTMTPVITLAVRVDSDRGGKKALEFADFLQGRLDRLNLESSLSRLEPLATAHFVPGGFKLLDGQGPDFDPANHTWTYVWQFEVKGTMA